jgi:glutamate dehydrogenase
VRQHRQDLDVAACIDRYRPGVEALATRMGELVQGSRRRVWEERRQQLVASGVPESLAEMIAGADSLFSLLGIIQVAEQAAQPVDEVAKVYFALGDHLDLHWFGQQIRGFDARSHWQTLACESYLDDLSTQQRALTARSLQHDAEAQDAVVRVSGWLDQHPLLVKRWQSMLGELRSTKVRDCAIFSVALRELLELSQA